MELRIKNISDRLQCIAEDSSSLELTRLIPLEVIHHTLLIDSCTTGVLMTQEQLDRCRKRIIDFGVIQFENRNRN